MTGGGEGSRLSTYLSLFKYFKKNSDFAKHDYQGFLLTKKILETNIGKVTPSTRILEIGCGQRFVRTLLFNSDNTVVTGIDYDFIATNFSFRNMLNIWRQNGFERFMKTLVQHILYDKQYYQLIEYEYKKPLKWSHLDVRRMNACTLHFPDNHFDFIFSNAVLEHIDNVETAFSEMARVLKKKWLCISWNSSLS
jgi:SAM-dependent methyltransferase